MRDLTALVPCLVGMLTGCDRGASLDEFMAKSKQFAAEGFYTEGAQFLRARAGEVRRSDLGRLEFEVSRLYHLANVHDLALAAAEEAIRLGVKEPDVFFIEADSLRSLMKSGAEEKFVDLLTRAPDHLQAKLGLARIRLKSSDPTSSLPLFDAYFKGVTPTDSSYKVALFEHARALRNVGRYQEAADRYMILLEDDPLEGTFYSGLAEALYRMKLRKEGRFVEEIYKIISQNAFEEHVEDRLRETGNTAFALGQKAVNRTRQRRYLEAFKSYLQALEVDQSDPRLRTFFADLAIQLRRFKEARLVLSTALKKGLQPSSGLWWLLGRLELEEENWREAVFAFQSGIQALQAEGDQGGVERGQAPAFPLHLALARSAIELADAPAARQALGRARELMPGSWEPSYWLGRVELIEGNAPQALTLFGEAGQKGGRDLADLAVYSAAAMAKVGRKDEAVSKLQAVIQSQPGVKPAHDELLRILRAEGTPSPAVEEAASRLEATRGEIRTLEARLRAQPLTEGGPTYLELGKLYVSLKDARAFDFFFLASDLLPRSVEAARLLLSGMKQSQDVFVRIRFLRRVEELEPRDESALAQLSGLYLKLHVRLDEAERLAERLHEVRSSAESWRLRAEAAVLKGEPKRAQGILAEALAAFPNEPALRELLARTGS